MSSFFFLNQKFNLKQMVIFSFSIKCLFIMAKKKKIKIKKHSGHGRGVGFLGVAKEVFSYRFDCFLGVLTNCC